MPFKPNKILAKIVRYGDHLSGHTSRQLRGDLDALRRSKNLGPNGIPQSTINHVAGLSEAATASTTNARTNTALGVVLGGGGGFLGIHKYHQHKDNKIMARIDSMYKSDYN